MLRRFLVLLGVSAAVAGSATAMAGEAGKVVFVTGQVQLASHAAALDAAVQEGDELSTGADGYVYVKTVDSGFLILRPNSKARIVTYAVDKANPSNTRVKLELLNGVARSISGTAVKQARQNFRFNTPVAAIGVRGTDFIVFTDQQTSRVAVVSGGIVVSGFAGGCGPEGSGPCEGSLSRELFAGQADVLLQVQRGQKTPQLLRGQAVAPDSAPPRSDEPVGKPVASVGAGSTPDVNLDVKKETALVNSGLTSQLTNGGGNAGGSNNGGKDTVTPPPVVVTDPPPVTTPEPPKPVVPSPNELQWGRWQTVAGMAPDAAVLAKMRDGTYENGYTLGSYVITRFKNTELVMPKDGTASFALTASEASLQKNGDLAVAAAVKDAHLDVDFSARKFSTGLTVYTDAASLRMNSTGTISSKGVLVNDLSADAAIRGYLGGNQAEQAGYIFKSMNSPLYNAEGVTIWKR